MPDLLLITFIQVNYSVKSQCFGQTPGYFILFLTQHILLASVRTKYLPDKNIVASIAKTSNDISGFSQAITPSNPAAVSKSRDKQTPNKLTLWPNFSML